MVRSGGARSGRAGGSSLDESSVIVTGLMGFGTARHGPVRLLGLVWHGRVRQGLSGSVRNLGLSKEVLKWLT